MESHKIPWFQTTNQVQWLLKPMNPSFMVDCPRIFHTMFHIYSKKTPGFPPYLSSYGSIPRHRESAVHPLSPLTTGLPRWRWRPRFVFRRNGRWPKLVVQCAHLEKYESMGKDYPLILRKIKNGPNHQPAEVDQEVFFCGNSWMNWESSLIFSMFLLPQKWVESMKWARFVRLAAWCRVELWDIKRLHRLPQKNTLWWTNIAMENGHRNSGFCH